MKRTRTIDQLSVKEKALLVDLYETDAYKALKKLMEAERFELAKSCLLIPADQLRYVQGQAAALKQLHLHLKELYDLHLQSERTIKG